MFDAAISVILAGCGSDKGAKREFATNENATEQERIEAEIAVHVRMHQGVDLRVTVFAVLILAGYGLAIKDGRTLFPVVLMWANFISGALSALCFFVAAFISRRNVNAVETPEQILHRIATEEPLMAAARQLSAMQRITARKARAANGSLAFVVIQMLFCGSGLVFPFMS